MKNNESKDYVILAGAVMNETHENLIYVPLYYNHNTIQLTRS